MILEFLIILFLIVLNGVFSMSEIALVSSKKNRLELSAKKGSKGASAALSMLSDPTRFLSTVQIGITLIGILTGMYSGAGMTTTVAGWLAQVDFLAPYASTLATVIVVLVVTYLTLVIGELIPKRLGMSNPETIASAVALPMNVLSKISKPFVSLLTFTTELLLKVLNIKSDENKVTEEEIRALIDEGTTTGAVEEIEQDLMENIFYLGDKRLEALMTHISEVISLPSDATHAQFMATFREHRYSVYPVYEGNPDNIVGVVSVKDIIAAPEDQSFDIKQFVRTVHFFPEYTKAYNVLEQFMESKVHQGFLVDEFGTLLGFITMNDLLNDLVGNLSEQEESISYQFIERDDTSWLADGRYPFVDFLKKFDIDDEPYETVHFHTLAGFMIHMLKKLPQEGDVMTWRQFRFEVVDMDFRRIDKLLITLTPEAAEPSDEPID